MRVWLGASMLLVGDLTGVRAVRSPLICATHVPDVTHAYTASALTPNEDIAVIRVQAQIEGPGQSCSANAIITVSDGTNDDTLAYDVGE